MSKIVLSTHAVCSGDTVKALVSQYRLSSSAAIIDIPANKPVRKKLMQQDELPAGLVINIPPNAAHLAKERLHALHAIRPAFFAHFDEIHGLADSKLQPVILASDLAAESTAVIDVLIELQELVSDAINEFSGRTFPLVDICKGMVHTHVAQPDDHAAVKTEEDCRCGLYWAVTPQVLELWRNMWSRQVLSDKWQEKDSDAAWRLTAEHLNTVRSIVVQRIEHRIRESLLLERGLHNENGD